MSSLRFLQTRQQQSLYDVRYNLVNRSLNIIAISLIVTVTVTTTVRVTVTVPVTVTVVTIAIMKAILAG